MSPASAGVLATIGLYSEGGAEGAPSGADLRPRPPPMSPTARNSGRGTAFEGSRIPRDSRWSQPLG